MSSQFKKGKPKTGGRKKGQPNHATVELRTMIREALYRNGGVDYLTEQAQLNPVAFMGLIAKILPKDVAVEHSGQIGISKIEIEFIDNTIEA